jgi:deoxyribodipyrimidine photolyase-related protein
METGFLVLGNQLFESKTLVTSKIKHVYMREDVELCTYFKFHKLKIFFFLAAMRSYAQLLREAGLSVTYEELQLSKQPYERHLIAWIKKHSLKKLACYEIEDKFFETRVKAAAEKAGVELEIWPSPMFLTNRTQFRTYLGSGKRPFMKTFYEAQRKRLKIMVDSNNQPVGGQWSFDELNRQPLPKTVEPPEPLAVAPSAFATQTALFEKVSATCLKHFADHPGDIKQIWFPVDRAGARKWLADFIEKRLAEFGPYEDALTDRSDFVFHSALTPFLNTGLLTPEEVVRAVLAAAAKRKINIASVEGFIRQLIGWREFIRGIYQKFSEKQDHTNFWNHRRQLNDRWYQATTGIPPLDDVIEKANRLGYAHHIERLMVVGNLMLLLEVEPREAHRWFMEMFIDSSDWVMGPNVYGMGLFSDGGIFATKPYICGSNYYRKMGGYKKAEWCDAVDGLYWSFVEKHESFFLKNPRLSMMVRSVQKMDSGIKSAIYAAADDLRIRLTTAPRA